MANTASFDDIKMVLLAEHAALLAGDFDTLESLTIRKESIASRVAQLPLSAEEAREIRNLSEKSARLLDVVSRAVIEAQSYLKDRHTPPDTHAYAANGARHKLSATHGVLTQKM